MLRAMGVGDFSQSKLWSQWHWCYYRFQVWEGSYKSEQCWHPSRASWNNGIIVWQKTFCPWFPYIAVITCLSRAGYLIICKPHRCTWTLLCHFSHLFIIIFHDMFVSWICKSHRCTWSASSRRSSAHPRGAIQPIAARRIRKTGPRWEGQKQRVIQLMMQDTSSKQDTREPDKGKGAYLTRSKQIQGCEMFLMSGQIIDCQFLWNCKMENCGDISLTTHISHISHISHVRAN